MRSRGSRSRPSGSFQAMRWMSCNTRAAGVIASSPNAKSAINVIVGEARPAQVGMDAPGSPHSYAAIRWLL
jgi:hypothetical protein